MNEEEKKMPEIFDTRTITRDDHGYEFCLGCGKQPSRFDPAWEKVDGRWRHTHQSP